MNPKIKAQWVEALRSGRYQQGDGALRARNNKFCCLGVLCDLHASAVGREWDWDDDGDAYSYGGYSELLPTSVMEWAELEDDAPTVQYDIGGTKCTDNLASLNDEGRTFDWIADKIEEQL